MNFESVIQQGKKGSFFGLPTGLKSLDKAIEGIQRKSIYGIASAPKVGKSALTLFSFIVNPYLYMLSQNKLDNVEWIYFSYEMDRIKNELKAAALFMYLDYGIWYITDKQGKNYDLSPSYFLNRKVDDNNNIISMSEEHEKMLKNIYKERIIPLFGEFDNNGKQIKKGKIIFYGDPDNPTGIYKELWKKAEREGKIITEEYINYLGERKQKIIGYKPNNEEKYTIVIIDNLRKLRIERGFTLKENMDKMVAYSVELRNLFNYTFVEIVHLNRSISNVDRLKFFKEVIYPTSNDLKDSSNLAEEADFLLTMFNPGDERYNIKEHFGYDLTKYPRYRSIHLVDSRDTESPIHMHTNFHGGISAFKDIVK